MLSSPVALVTGASRGIGRAVAIELGRTGFSVAVNYSSNASAANECVRSVIQEGAAAAAFQADIGENSNREALVRDVLQHFGRIDLLVNNAGVAPDVRADILEASEESFDRLVRINLKGPYFLTQTVARQMIRQVQESPGEKPPQIITISSVSAVTPSVNRGDYCISKAGLSMLTALYAARLAEFGICVYEIRPGVIATDMTKGVQQKYDSLIEQGAWPLRRWGQPLDVALAVGAIARRDFPFSTGEVFNVDGGFHVRAL